LFGSVVWLENVMVRLLDFEVRFLRRLRLVASFHLARDFFLFRFAGLSIHWRLSISSDFLFRGQTGVFAVKFIFAERPRSATTAAGARCAQAQLVTAVVVVL
jgi:hypothetical protein